MAPKCDLQTILTYIYISENSFSYVHLYTHQNICNLKFEVLAIVSLKIQVSGMIECCIIIDKTVIVKALYK